MLPFWVVTGLREQADTNEGCTAVSSITAVPESIPDISVGRVPLTQVSRGSRVRVDLGGLDADDRELLRAMGLRAECVVEVCRVGEPCILEVREGCGGGCRIGMSRRLADRVLTEGAGV